jgi:hypothetical protein
MMLGGALLKLRAFVSLLFATGLFVVCSLPVSAGGLTVYSGKIESAVISGSNNTYTMEVANTSDAPMDIGVDIQGYGMSPTQDFIVLEPTNDQSPYSASSFLKVSPTGFHLEPGKSQIITVTANVPAGISNGGRYAIVYIHTAPTGNGVGVISAVAARVLLTIPGSNLDTTSQITGVTLIKSVAQQPAGISFTVANNGNYHFKPQIQATVRSGDKVVATTELVAPGWPIIPGYSRQFKLDLAGTSPLPAGMYQVDVEVKDESGALITKGTFPLELTEKQDVLAPITTSSPPVLTPTATTTSPSSTTLTLIPTTSSTQSPKSSSFPTSLITGFVGGVAMVASLLIVTGRRKK